MDTSKVLKLLLKLLPKQLLIDMGVKTMGKIIDGYIKPDDIYDAVFEICKSISKFGNERLGKNYENFVEAKLQTRVIDTIHRAMTEGFNFDEPDEQ